MRVIHLADLHLGFRAYQRLTPAGINVRESDVARAFRDAIEQVIAIAPELVVVAGDVFHASRPPNNAIVHAQKQLVRLRAELANTVIVIVAGNHDCPRSSDTGDILALFEPLGVHVASSRAKRIVIPQLDLAVLAVPDVPGVQPRIEPDPSCRYNVLVLHGEVEFTDPAWSPGAWDYIALGHYHVHRRVGDRAYYAGALDFTSSNPWGELAEQAAAGVPGKGLVLADLDAHTATFHPIEAARPFADLGEIDADGRSPADVDAAIAAAVEACEGGIAGKVVRLTVRNLDRSVLQALDQKALRAYRARALHFQLATHRPEAVQRAGAPAEPRRRMKSLEDIVRESIGKRFAGEDATAMTDLALKYLQQAEDKEPQRDVAPPTAIAEPEAA